ncbi:hypothetical protein EVAR_11544_1 [Eumeta japonica]|uniref:Uncharacterized protein n=1 Tax=Eumeta variegata TaxID=151549 RepID=A0A4C1TYS1_EUMVA|nr:hypothetical protein EVAR_11544_1 [Eumeta japonica]
MNSYGVLTYNSSDINAPAALNTGRFRPQGFIMRALKQFKTAVRRGLTGILKERKKSKGEMKGVKPFRVTLFYFPYRSRRTILSCRLKAPQRRTSLRLSPGVADAAGTHPALRV